MIAGTFPTAVLVAILGLIIGLVVLFTSNFEEPPKYHSLFGYLGFVVSVCWIYGLANEVVDLLQAISTMFNLSDAILGLTVLAWGNSLGGLFCTTAFPVKRSKVLHLQISSPT